MYITKLTEKGIKYFHKRNPANTTESEFWRFTGLNSISAVWYDSRTLKVFYIGVHVEYYLREPVTTEDLTVEQLRLMIWKFNNKDLHLDYDYPL